MLRVKKIINNNLLCVIDENGREMIVGGKGIGFQKRRGQQYDGVGIERTYRMEGRAEQKKLLELVEQIPVEHLILTEELIAYIKQQLSYKINESLLITLSDHISFAIVRKQEGLEFRNPLKGSIMTYYPKEYRLGVHCRNEIERKLGVCLHEDEAAFIALHIVNAEMNTEMKDAYAITKLIEGSLSIVEEFYQKSYDRDSLDFDRFIMHLRYFGQRLFQGKAFEDLDNEQDVLFRRMIAGNYKRHYTCAKKIAQYVKQEYDKNLSEEEMTYLTIHLKRINSGSEE